MTATRCDLCGKRFRPGAYRLPYTRTAADGRTIAIGSECVKKFDAEAKARKTKGQLIK